MTALFWAGKLQGATMTDRLKLSLFDVARPTSGHFF
jgi:hypothetical protein